MTNAVNKSFETDFWWKRETATHISFAPPENRRINCDHDCFVTSRLRALHKFARQTAVAPNIELIPQRASRHCCNFFDAARTESRQCERQCVSARDASDGKFALRMSDASKTSWRKSDRKRHWLPHDRCRRVDLRDVAQNSWY